MGSREVLSLKNRDRQMLSNWGTPTHVEGTKFDHMPVTNPLLVRIICSSLGRRVGLSAVAFKTLESRDGVLAQRLGAASCSKSLLQCQDQPAQAPF